jgi:DNA repair exonuclease SbcCD ATPase subunit
MRRIPDEDPLGAAASPEELRRKFDQLQGQRSATQKQRDAKTKLMRETEEFLAMAPAVEAALEKLSEEMFGRLAAVIERHQTLALQEVLQQPIGLKVERDFKNKRSTMRFYVERDGREEDIMRGQGGSVANILSVGLRIFALTQLDPKRHRRFLVLDEQDCWLAPELVPRLVKIVHDVAKALGYQVIMISHHAASCFEPYAQKVCRFVPTGDGVKVEEWTPRTSNPDEGG